MTDLEKQKLAQDTYELGVKMNNTFAQGKSPKEYMILAIVACISGLTNKTDTYDLQIVCDFSGEWFKKLRKSKDYTLRQVEDATGLSNAYLSQFETGKIKKPSHNTIKKLLDFYNEGIVVERDYTVISNLKG